MKKPANIMSRTMSQNNIMEDLVKRQLFEEITRHLLSDDRPSDYMNRISEQEEFKKYPFMLLLKLKATEQSPRFHPEGSVWNHTMMVVDEAAKVRNECQDPEVFMWAALLHDIGKPGTTRYRNNRITSYNHDISGEKLCIDFLRTFKEDYDGFTLKVSSLVRYHMHILYILKNLPYKDVKGLLQKVDIEDIALLCRCDRLGRTGADRQETELEYREFLSRLSQLSLKKS